MIVIGMLLAIALIGAYLFLGMKISESIIHNDIKIFFWSLYTVTLLTLVNVSLSIYFYSSLKDKKGPLGPRGVKGKMGDSGEGGGCKVDCKSKTVQLVIERMLEEHYEENDITPGERKVICNLINNEKPDDNGNEGNKNIINKKDGGWELNNLDDFKKALDFGSLGNKSLNYRIREQKTDSSYEDKLIDIIVNASSSLGTNYQLNDKTTTECI